MAIRHGHVRAMRGNDCLPARPTLPDRKAMPAGTAAYMERGTPTGFMKAIAGNCMKRSHMTGSKTTEIPACEDKSTGIAVNVY